jgi:hypothetical protein
VLSHNNTDDDMADALEFCDAHGVEEHYLIDPEAETVTAYRRRRGKLVPVLRPFDAPSPVLGIRFGLLDGKLAVFPPDGCRFVSPDEREAELHERCDRAQNRAEEAEARAQAAEAQVEALAVNLRSAGLEP